MKAALSVDRESFLLLTAALAASHCLPASTPASPSPEASSKASPQDVAPPPSVLTVAIPKPDPQPLPLEQEDPVAEEPDEPTKPTCDNDQGQVSCDFIDHRFRGPACEGFAGSCGLLKDSYGFRPRVAAEIAKCWKKRGRAACNIFVRKQCIRASLKHACPDPSFTPFCEGAIKRCRQKGQYPQFKVSECVSTLSSLKGGNLNWAKGAIGPSREGCRLMFPVY